MSLRSTLGLDPGTRSTLYNASVAINNSDKTLLRAGELAQLAGVSTDTLRHYERKGVLAPARRLANGYRQYPAQALARIRLVRRALTVGFTLDELARFLKVRDRGGVPCREVRQMAAAKLAELEARLREMTSLRDQLRASVRDWDIRLGKTPAGEQSFLLEALASSSEEAKNAHTSPLASLQWHRSKKGKKRENNEK